MYTFEADFYMYTEHLPIKYFYVSHYLQRDDVFKRKSQLQIHVIG